MSNSFNISVIPEIAALEAKIDTIDTVVDNIRAVDVVNLSSAIANNAVDIGVIHNTDIPDLSTIVTNIGVAVVAIDTVVDDIQAKTDTIPQKIRGTMKTAHLSTTSAAYVEVLNVTGQGILYGISVNVADAADKIRFKITIDGIASEGTHTGDTDINSLVSCITSASGDFYFNPVAFIQTDMSGTFYFSFSTSLLIEIKRDTGTANNVLCSVWYAEDEF
ncbi:MAG: hypothetical protein GH151_15185 [Bacteroidetes bacterium]|nr:hypothetical protein [Bacteroidota bacterium]